MDSQTLRSIIKTARDLMRKDVGCSSDVDRIPQISWMLFLKCFDDLEKDRHALDPKYTLAIPTKYRWSVWATNKKFTGDDLIKFINNDLFPILTNLKGNLKSSRRDVIASIFQGLNNRISSGYILRQIIDCINQIDFTNTDDIQTMGMVYEDMLVQMRDAAKNHGEFYTPRPVIRFIVNQIKPSLAKSEKVLDPACGTGGFLTESFTYMENNAKSKMDHKKLLDNTLFGTDKKPMPYLLCMMNMALHKLDHPNIVCVNPLARSLNDIGEDDRYDVIMTNPPFGGEEEKGITSNMPIGLQTSDTALSFLLYIMTSLKKNGRSAIILPDGPLFAVGVAAKIKKKLIEEFNLHTIVRLPKSIFEPYTSVATNILFFERTSPTKHIWYYSMKVSERVRSKAKEPKYSKTKPIEYEDLSIVEKWFKDKKKNKNAWKVKVKDIKEYNLDQKNPNDVDDTLVLPPDQIIDNIIKTRKNMILIFEDIKKIMNKEIPTNK